MFARPCQQSDWFAEATIAGEENAFVTSAPFPRRVTRQATRARVNTLKAMACDPAVLRPGWNAFALADEDLSFVEQKRRRSARPAAVTRATATERRNRLVAWMEQRIAERLAIRERRLTQTVFDPAMDALRAAMTAPDEVEEAPSAAMRLSAHLISAALIALALPLGVMALVCTVLRGGDMRIAARMSTLTGFAALVLTNNADVLQQLML